jgi:hypothetical protein
MKALSECVKNGRRQHDWFFGKDGAAQKERRVGWWLADAANLISISCAVIAQVCLRFVNRHWETSDITAVTAGFIVDLGQCFVYLALAWIAIGAVFATKCRVGKPAANGAGAYVVLLVSVVVGVFIVLQNPIPV